MTRPGKKPFFKTAMRPGNVLIMLGYMRSGKTNWSVVMMGKATGKGYPVFTNTHFFKENQIDKAKELKLLNKNITYKDVPENITVATNVYTLLKGLHKNQLKEPHSLVFLDEAALFAGSTMALQTRVRWLKNLIFTIGKLNASILLIWQAKKTVIPLIREELVTYELTVKRLGRNRWCEVYKVMDDGSRRLYWKWMKLPEASLPYDTRGISEFVFDLDLDYLFAKISAYNTLEMAEHFLPVLDEAHTRYMRDVNLEKKKKEPTLRDKCRELKKKGVKLKEGVKIVGCSHETWQRA